MSAHGKRNALLGVSGLAAIGLAAGVVGLLGASTASCGASAANTPIRSFDRAQRTDTICLHVLNGDGFNIPAVSEPQQQCAPVPEDVNGIFLEYHEYALVTQSAKGQLAAVDLTAGFVVDVNKATPGTDFLPVGALPTDVAVTSDGQWLFVPAADPFKPAIYAIPGTSILGDSQELGALGGPTEQPPSITSWPVCGLPQAPGQMNIVNRPDGSYELAVVLPGDSNHPAKLITVNPNPLEDGTIAPGSLAPCPITSTVVLGSAGAVDMASTQPTWSDGVTWIDGGAPAEVVPGDTACGTTVTVVDGGTGTTTTDGGTGGTLAPDAGSGSTGVISTGGVANVPHGTALAAAGNILYIGDSGLPLIHVIDVSVPGAARELAPLVATSITLPNQKVTIKDLAVSPVTSAFQRFLYAVDGSNGTVIVYDVSDPVNSPHVPLTRPHPEVNPFQPPDRITFPSPVAAVSFVQHDRFLQRLSNSSVPLTAYKSGLICNPNPQRRSVVEPDRGRGRSRRRARRVLPGRRLGHQHRPPHGADASARHLRLRHPDQRDGRSGGRGRLGCALPPAGSDGAGAGYNAPNSESNRRSASGPRSSIAPPEPSASGIRLTSTRTTCRSPSDSRRAPPVESPVTLESFYPVSAPHRRAVGVLPAQ